MSISKINRILISTISYLNGVLFNYSDNLKLLLHFDGNDGEQTTIDSTGNHSISFVATAQLDTAQKKWGTASLLLDGNSDYVYSADSPDWDIFGDNTQEYTLDFFVKFNDYINPNYLFLHADDEDNRWFFYHIDTIGFYFGLESGNTRYVVLSGGAITDNDWHHVAICKKYTGTATLWGLYVDGVQIDYDSSGVTDTFSGNLYIGYYQLTNDYYLNGWLDEIRIQKSNYFGANPVVGLTDTITVPLSSYEKEIKKFLGVEK